MLASIRDRRMETAMASHSIEVLVPSLEQAEAQIAEFWVGGELFAQTLPDAGELVLRIEPRRDGQAWEVGFHDLRRSLDRAVELLGAPGRIT
jgi:hypothetical protein